MGGEGSMASAIQTLRQNRALLKKRKFKNIKDLLYESSGKTELEFKQVSKEELFRIKQKIRKQQKQIAQIELGILIASFVLAFVICYAFYLWISS